MAPLVGQTVNTQIIIPAVSQTSVVITPSIAARAALPTPDAATFVVEAGDLDEDGSTPSVQVTLGASTLDWKCPVPGAKFTNDWGQSRSGGRSHTGTDMLAPRGTPVLAPFSGTAVQKASSRGGLSVYLNGPDGMQIFGAHLSSYGTSGKVKAGTIIGYVGNTGNASGAAPHLHIEIHPKKGAKTNPYPVMKKICP
jgi:murein DD-endopeptidase MepM/ murein hydrolase activator NlpD